MYARQEYNQIYSCASPAMQVKFTGSTSSTHSNACNQPFSCCSNLHDLTRCETSTVPILVQITSVVSPPRLSLLPLCETKQPRITPPLKNLADSLDKPSHACREQVLSQIRVQNAYPQPSLWPPRGCLLRLLPAYLTSRPMQHDLSATLQSAGTRARVCACLPHRAAFTCVCKCALRVWNQRTM